MLCLPKRGIGDANRWLQINACLTGNTSRGRTRYIMLGSTRVASLHEIKLAWCNIGINSLQALLREQLLRVGLSGLETR